MAGREVAVRETYRNKGDPGTLAVPNENEEVLGTLSGAVIEHMTTMANPEIREDPRKRARREAKEENLSECRAICIFALYLLVFTSVVLFEQVASASRLADAIRGKLDGGPVPLKSVESVAGLYGFLEEVFVPAMYENSTDTNIAKEMSEFYHPIDVSNRIVGGIRLRQSRVKYSQGCQITPLFQQYNIQCYPPFSAASESQATFGDDGQFRYATDETGSTYAGALGAYNAHGFMQILPTSSADAAKLKLGELRNSSFMGPWTRALFVEFTVWNSNTGIYASVQLLVEFGASGGTSSSVKVLTMSMRSLVAGGIGTPGDITAFIGVLVVMAFVCWYMAEEAWELKADMWGYFSDGWNILDWINMLLLWLAFALRIFVFIQAKELNIGLMEIDDKDFFQNLRPLAQYVELVKLLHAFNAVLLWGKVVKYIRKMPLVRDLLRTVWNSLDLFMPFLTMLCVAFVGFAMSYNIGFGDKIWELTSFSSSFIYLCRAFLRDVKLMPAYSVTPFFGAFLILIFYVTFLLVGVNVLFAIIADAMFHAKVKESKRERGKKTLEELAHQDEPVEEFIREVQRKVKRQLEIRAPAVHAKLYKRKKKQKELQEDPKEALTNHPLDGNLDDSDSDDSDWFQDGAYGNGLPNKEELMRAIEHMAGRILSEISIVGIEIKSELHDICERVAQMLFAVQELSSRAEVVRLEQEQFTIK